MKKFVKAMKSVNWRIVFTIGVIIAMTLIGVTLMEYDWCETMTAVIWLVGELLIVMILLGREANKYLNKLVKELWNMIEEIGEIEVLELEDKN